MEEATLLNEYTAINNLSMWYTSVVTYDNGYAIMNSNMMDSCTTSYTIEGNLFKYYDVNMGGYGYFELVAQESDTYNSLDIYTPAGTLEKPASIQETYSAVIDFAGQPMPVEFLVYGDEDYTGNGEYFAQVNVNGFGVFSTIKVNIDSDANTLTSMGKTFNIGNDNSLTEVTE